MAEPRVVSVLVPAVGGQGGGVLAEWIVDAALAEGLTVQGTSIPGVAQRTGSTSYYIEVVEGSGESAEIPVLSLYPVPGALDVLLAPELLEVGRAIELGLPSPARTTIVASLHRLYSIHEKMPSGRGIYPQADLQAAARAFSRRLLALDALALAREHGTEVNAVLLGALAASGALPIGEAAYRGAIESKGVQVASNLKGFEVGLERGRALMAAAGNGGPAPGAPPSAPVIPRELGGDVASLPPALRPLVEAALARLVDYQDLAYARRYLERLRPFVVPGADGETAAAVARQLALWMSYEDAVRVAQLKTRASRFDRIRAAARAPEAEVTVVDYLKPDLDEIYGVLPYRLVAPVAHWAERRWPERRPALAQHVKSTTIAGYLRLWLLARLRRWRPISYRACHEHARMERWLRAVQDAAALDPALAREVAQAAQLVKGYGQVRRRMETRLDDLLVQVLRAGELERRAGGDGAAARELARRYRQLVLEGPDGEGQAPVMAAGVIERLTAGDVTGARAVLA